MVVRVIADEMSGRRDGSSRLGYASAQRPWMKNVAGTEARSERLEQPLGRARLGRAIVMLGVEGQGDAPVGAVPAHFSTPVMTSPRVKNRWASRNAMTGMTIVMSVPAWISPGSR